MTTPLQFEIITGSRRAHGNTEQVAETVAGWLVEAGAGAGILRLREHDIQPCGMCGECNTRTAPCAHADDMPALIERLKRADAILYMAPVHGYGLAHPMQIFIERAGVGYLRFDRPLANKVGGAVVTGRRYGHVGVFNQIVNNLLLNRMILVGSGYPAVVMGGTPGKALEDGEGMEAVRTLVMRMLGMTRLLRLMPAAAVNGLLAPDTANERQVKTA